MTAGPLTVAQGPGPFGLCYNSSLPPPAAVTMMIRAVGGDSLKRALLPAFLIPVSVFTGEEAPMYKSVPVQEPQYREDFLRCESCFISPHAIALAAHFPARVPSDADGVPCQSLWLTT